MSELSPVSLDVFLGRYVHVKCCGGYEVAGVLVGCDVSRHGGMGTLILFKEAFPRDCCEWILVRCWTVITCDR